MENPYPISVDNTLKRNQNVDNYSMRNFRDINVQFLNLFLIAENHIILLDVLKEITHNGLQGSVMKIEGEKHESWIRI